MFDVQYSEKFHIRKLQTRQPHLNNVATLPCETVIFSGISLR